MAFKKIFIYAPNINSGGGLTLLTSLLKSWDGDLTLTAILDERCKNSIKNYINSNINIIYWVNPNIISRIISEIKLFQYCFKKEIYVISFHNIPPLICKPKKLSIYLQNRLLLDYSADYMSIAEKSLILFQKLLIKWWAPKKTLFIVQTPSMQNVLMDFLGRKNSNFKIEIMPFVDLDIFKNSPKNKPKKDLSFFYPSACYEHKNHTTLFEAWKLLGKENIFPFLYLTIGKNENTILSMIDEYNKNYNLNIINIGIIENNQLVGIYHEMTALIFPSKTESLGLPLIEAASAGLPIIASELDFVRDVCIPSETFDPYSSTSIARAVKRFLNIKNELTEPMNSKQFWGKLKC